MNTLRTLVLDGDPISRKALIELLAEYPAPRIIEECCNGLEAIPVLRDFKPDIFICEVETSGINGFSLLETIPLKNRPATIFISNLDHFGVRAFEVSAVDYILKPVRKERLFQALERARMQVESRTEFLLIPGRAELKATGNSYRAFGDFCQTRRTRLGGGGRKICSPAHGKRSTFSQNEHLCSGAGIGSVFDLLEFIALRL